MTMPLPRPLALSRARGVPAPGRPVGPTGSVRAAPVRSALALLVAGAALLAGPAGVLAQEGREGLPSIAEKTEGMRHLEGFFDLYWDESRGDLYWEIDRLDTEFLYQVSLASGLGSNPVGLDRGQLGATHVLEARRVGPRVLLVEPNHRYRARSDNPAEVEAVRVAFAPSTLWGFEVAAETGDRVLVDATAFFLRDAHDIVGTLERADQGSFELDESRSAFHLPRTRAFPRNTEVEVSQTFTSEDPGPLVRRTAADGGAVTLRVHHSLVELPGPGYEPRPADPRVGAFGITFHDYAAPIDRDLEVRWVARHRLEKRDPEAERSEPVEPIVYHLDPGVPEPIRSALLEGASWWNQAFEAAGYIDAFRVEMLPDTADPMDLRYNVIHWTHRRTRGWSYGGTVVDPRTGEIIRGNVNLGSLRLRQDRLIGQGLLPPYGAMRDGRGAGAREAGARRPGAARGGSARGRDDGFDVLREGAAPGPRFGVCDLAEGPTFGYLAEIAANGDPVELALARVRQLSAHEVGHTLGLAHNFIASTYGRASVMDYPAPLVRITASGELDLADAYDTGIGEYDAFAITWLYGDFPDGVDEEAALDSLVRQGLADGMRFISDADARPAGAAHPLAHLWDNGADPVEMLGTEMEVRRIGLERFGEEAIRPGEPLAALEGVLVPLYLHHRYQVEAAVRSVGGVDYNYAVRGDGQFATRPVPPERQRAALDAVLATLSPEALTLPASVREAIPPPAYGMSGQETFAGRTGPTFDPLGAAASAAALTVDLLLQPQRMARLVEQGARSPAGPDLEEILGRLMERTWRATPPTDPYRAQVGREVQRVVLDRMLEIASDADAAPSVRAVVAARLDGLADRLEGIEAPDAHRRMAAEDIRRWQARSESETARSAPPEAPPGSPIGHP